MKHYLTYGLLVVCTLIAGLASRSSAIELHPFLEQYLGDTLWALLVYWGFRFVLKQKSESIAMLAALLFSFLIEVSQLYQADWANNIRQYKLVGLVFGYGFLWSDIVCYSIGIAFGYITDKLLVNKWIEKNQSS